MADEARQRHRPSLRRSADDRAVPDAAGARPGAPRGPLRVRDRPRERRQQRRLPRAHEALRRAGAAAAHHRAEPQLRADRRPASGARCGSRRDPRDDGRRPPALPRGDPPLPRGDRVGLRHGVRLAPRARRGRSPPLALTRRKRAHSADQRPRHPRLRHHLPRLSRGAGEGHASPRRFSPLHPHARVRRRRAHHGDPHPERRPPSGEEPLRPRALARRLTRPPPSPLSEPLPRPSDAYLRQARPRGVRDRRLDPHGPDRLCVPDQHPHRARVQRVVPDVDHAAARLGADHAHRPPGRDPGPRALRAGRSPRVPRAARVAPGAVAGAGRDGSRACVES